jgi:hypothetical protein
MRYKNLLPTPSQELVIKYPDGERDWKDGTPSDLKLRLVSADSLNFHSVVTRQAQDALLKGDELSILERQRNVAEQIASCIIGWEGLEDDNDVPIPYSKERATELILNPELTYIREQVDAFVAKRSNFFRVSAPATSGAREVVSAAKHASKPEVAKPAAAARSSAKAAEEATAVNA